MTRALVIDDEPAICRCFEALFADLNCEVTVSASAEDGLRLLKAGDFDVVVLDVRLPGMDGVEALPLIRAETDAPIIVMTAHGTLSTAVSVVEEGAFEYLPKPFDLDQVSRVLQRAIAQSSAVRPTADPATYYPTAAMEIVGNSLPMQQLFRQIALASQHDAPVLITGESGSGKELVAHAIHRHSQRRDKQIVPVHLASLNESLMERELFGHAAGAFTGASAAQEGLIIRADGGTLFLDEIGETPAAVQVKLLRTIETGEFYRVGSSAPAQSAFRLVTATNRSVEELRSSESFRDDFFYRLSTIHIHVPPLRDRMKDVPRLAQHFLNHASSNGDRVFSPEALAALSRRPYPGNVRELRSVVVQAANESRESEIGADSLGGFQQPQSAVAGSDEALRRTLRTWATQALASDESNLLIKASELLESELIEAAIEHAQGNRTAAAQRLGIHRETLREKLSKGRNITPE